MLVGEFVLYVGADEAYFYFQDEDDYCNMIFNIHL